jgi:AraC family transcriptional regulator, arabinose operon regulatory protein
MSIKQETKRASARSLRTQIREPQAIYEAPIQDPRQDPRIRIVLDFFNANLHRRIRLIELAEAAKISPSRLSHLFKAEMGLSPGQYLMSLRMQKAAKLLATSRLSVKQIMALVGYDNKSHFVRHFRRLFGQTPSEYRKASSTP